MMFFISMVAFIPEFSSCAQNSVWKLETPYILQIKAVETENEAVEWISKLSIINEEFAYYTESKIKDRKWYRIRIGGFASESLAREKGAELAREEVVSEFFTTQDNLTYLVINNRGVNIDECLRFFFNDEGDKLPLLEFDLINYAKESFTEQQKAQNKLYLSEDGKKWGKGKPIYSLSESHIVDMDGDSASEIVFIFNQFYENTLFPTGYLLAVANANKYNDFDICDFILLDDINIMDAEEGHDYEISVVKSPKPEILITELTWRIGSGIKQEKRYRLSDKKLTLFSAEE